MLPEFCLLGKDAYVRSVCAGLGTATGGLALRICEQVHGGRVRGSAKTALDVLATAFRKDMIVGLVPKTTVGLASYNA